MKAFLFFCYLAKIFLLSALQSFYRLCILCSQLFITITPCIHKQYIKLDTVSMKMHTHNEAHISIALDSIPLIFTGFKLQRNTPSLSCNSSFGTSPTRPLITVRGSASPKSTVSIYRESASGCYGNESVRKETATVSNM